MILSDRFKSFGLSFQYSVKRKQRLERHDDIAMEVRQKSTADKDKRLDRSDTLQSRSDTLQSNSSDTLSAKQFALEAGIQVVAFKDDDEGWSHDIPSYSSSTILYGSVQSSRSSGFPKLDMNIFVAPDIPPFELTKRRASTPALPYSHTRKLSQSEEYEIDGVRCVRRGRFDCKVEKSSHFYSGGRRGGTSRFLMVEEERRDSGVEIPLGSSLP